MKKIGKGIVNIIAIMLLCIMATVTINAISSCNHTTKNGKCGLCNAVIVELGSTVKIEKYANSKGDWVEYSNVISITEIGSASTSLGSYVSCVMSATIKGIALGEADLFLLVKDSNQIIEQYKVIVVEHQHVFSSTMRQKGTCINKAVVEFSCDCGYSYETETEVDTTNHIGDEKLKQVLVEPTCVLIGKGEYECACGYTFTKSIPTIAHTYTSSVTTEPTCFKDGVTTYTCTCGDSYTEAIPKKEHEYSTWEVKTKPTCTKSGMEWSYCLNCDNDFEREIPATDHTVIEYVMRATTDEKAAYGGDGAYITACDVCNEIFKQDFFARPAEYKLSTSAYTYNGNVRKPTVTVKDADGKTLVAGQDYDVIYPDGMKLPGEYKVTVLFKGNYLGEKHLTFTIKPKATTGLKAKTQDTKTITLSWSKTTGATGYEVYQYNSQTKKYVKIKTATSTSYKVTSLTAGTTYKFKVRAYTKADDSTKIYGSYSSVFSTATKTAKPTLKTATLSSSKVALTWNNVNGESGYEIYYSTSQNGTYKKLSGIAANKVSFTTSKLTAGKTYYFKVRTYKTVGDNKVYSAFSNIKSVKISVVYYITKTGKKYHVDGCRSLSRSKIQISYSNAVARGYKPCNSCIL